MVILIRRSIKQTYEYDNIMAVALDKNQRITEDDMSIIQTKRPLFMVSAINYRINSFRNVTNQYYRDCYASLSDTLLKNNALRFKLKEVLIG